ncbi:hypothetical protein MY11210_003086 [Beauveria gryllotalpidicola]
MASRPSGLIATQGIELLTFGTPNGHKVSILLEELKSEYGLQYTFQSIDISQNIQKEPWFVALNPNGRIPVIVDHDNGGLAVFEGSAILSYLTRRYDKQNKFSFDIEDTEYTIAESWIGWQHGGLGPMQGQANHFLRSAPETIPYAMQRYVGEVERLYGILDKRLTDRDYVAGVGMGRFSIADISLLGWVNFLGLIPVTLNQFPAVQKWWDRCYKRPAVKAGINVPGPAFLSPEKELTAEEQKKRASLRDIVQQAKSSYGYKYKSP